MDDRERLIERRMERSEISHGRIPNASGCVKGAVMDLYTSRCINLVRLLAIRQHNRAHSVDEGIHVLALGQYGAQRCLRISNYPRWHMVHYSRTRKCIYCDSYTTSCRIHFCLPDASGKKNLLRFISNVWQDSFNVSPVFV